MTVGRLRYPLSWRPLSDRKIEMRASGIRILVRNFRYGWVSSTLEVDISASRPRSLLMASEFVISWGEGHARQRKNKTRASGNCFLKNYETLQGFDNRCRSDDEHSSKFIVIVCWLRSPLTVCDILLELIKSLLNSSKTTKIYK